jgi:hypothetical protein
MDEEIEETFPFPHSLKVFRLLPLPHIFLRANLSQISYTL